MACWESLEAVRRGVILPAVFNAGRMMRYWLTTGRSGEQRTLTSPGAVAVPYGVAIALGAIVWWFWGGQAVTYFDVRSDEGGQALVEFAMVHARSCCCCWSGSWSSGGPGTCTKS